MSTSDALAGAPVDAEPARADNVTPSPVSSDGGDSGEEQDEDAPRWVTSVDAAGQSSVPQAEFPIESGEEYFPSTQSKKKSYVYDYQSPKPDIRERFKKDIATSILEKPEPPVGADIVSSEVKAKTLNPKLTRRAYVYNYEPPRPDLREDMVRQLREGPPNPTESDLDCEEAPVALVVEEQQPVPVPRAVAALGPAERQQLLHTGSWQPPEYTAGKLKKGTGLWLCCGSREQFSLYCNSMAHRQGFQKELASQAAAAEQAVVYSRMVEEERRGPWERQEITAVEQEAEDVEEGLMQQANSEESTLNGPMLISWTHKNCASHRTALSGLNYLLRTLYTGEGCVLFHRHEGCDTVLKAYNLHPKHSEILLTCLKLWCQILDCNHTRDFLIDDTVVLQAVFSIANRYMRSEEHVTVAMRCLMQCARSEVCRLYILEHCLLRYYTIFCKSFSKKPDIIRSALRSFNWVATSDERLIDLFKIGCVNTTLKCMERHISNSEVTRVFIISNLGRLTASYFLQVLAPALLFMTRVAKIHLPAAEYIVHKQAVPTVVNALRALYSNELLQVEGLKMLRALSKSQEGWDQISKMKGGWQAICQGTAVGDALIHELPGSFHNPGWCIGETPHLPLLERRKLAVAAHSAAANMASRIRPKGAWTTHSLRQFMGLTMKPTKLNINNEEHDVHFEVISTLDLLPNPREEKEEWFGRINRYETDNDIKISDMVDALISMRLKKKMEDKAALKESLIEDEEKEYIKPIYVAGKLFNQKDIEESDKNLEDHLAGVV